MSEDLIPQAPQLECSLIDKTSVPIQVYESRTSLILNAKGTLKSPKKNKGEYEFFMQENEILPYSEDSISLVSQEDFAGIKDHVYSVPGNGNLTIRSHRGKSHLFKRH